MQKTEFYANLDTLQEFTTKMEDTSSNKVKLAILKEYATNPFIVKVLNYTYNGYKKYGIHSKVLRKNAHLIAPENFYPDLFQLLDDLAENKLTGHSAVKAVNAFLQDLDEKYHVFIHRILSRDLNIRANGRSINKAVPGCLPPPFSVALANKYSPKRVDLINEEWYGSRKLDGVRCIFRKENETITAYSRSGKEFETLDKIKNQIANLPGNFVLDGEICMVDENGMEDFQGIMKQIRRKNHTIENPKFLVFDYLTIREFDSHKSYDNSLSDRIETANNVLANLPYIEVIDQELITSDEQFAEMVKDAEAQGFEGIMIRRNSDYEGNRGWHLQKVKKFHDNEYVVQKVQMGNMRWIENGNEVLREGLRNIIIEHKGCRVSVGSGFSKEEREFYHTNPNELIGKTVTVQYFEETQNQNGGYSLRFPVIKHIYENGRDV